MENKHIIALVAGVSVLVAGIGGYMWFRRSQSKSSAYRTQISLEGQEIQQKFNDLVAMIGGGLPARQVQKALDNLISKLSDLNTQEFKAVVEPWIDNVGALHDVQELQVANALEKVLEAADKAEIEGPVKENFDWLATTVAEKTLAHIAQVAKEGEKELDQARTFAPTNVTKDVQKDIADLIAMQTSLVEPLLKKVVGPAPDQQAIKRAIDADPRKAEKEALADAIAQKLAQSSKLEILAALDPLLQSVKNILTDKTALGSVLAFGYISQSLSTLAQKSSNPDIQSIDEWLPRAYMSALMSGMSNAMQKEQQ